MIDYDHEDIQEGSRVLLEADCMEYCTEKGFTRQQARAATDLCLKLYDTLDTESKLPHLIRLFQQELVQLQSQLTQRCCTILCEYITTTLFQHFSLYKYVATEPRTVHKKELEKTIETLEAPPPFSLAISDKIWNYNHRMTQIDSQVAEQDAKRAEEVADLKTDRRNVTSQLKSLPISDADNLTLRERIKQMIESSITTQTCLTTKMLQHELEAAQEALLKDIEKVIVPRPSPLGNFPLRVVPSRGAARETRDLNSTIASRMSVSQETTRKSAGKSRNSKR